MAVIELEERRLADGRPLLVRTIEPDDAPAVLELYRSVLREGRYTVLELDEFERSADEERETIRKEREHSASLRVVAEVDGAIVGTARVRAGALRRTAHFAEVDSVWVAAEWRKHGIGNALMEAIVRWSEQQPGLEKLSLFVFSTSTAAIGLYQRHGFIIEGRCPRDIKFGPDDYADTVVMGRTVG